MTTRTRVVTFSLVILVVGILLMQWDLDENQKEKQLMRQYHSYQTRKLLQYQTICDEISFRTGNSSVLESITKYHNQSADLQRRKQVFLMLNGRNYGILLNWESSCLYELAFTAVNILRPTVNLALNGLRLYSQIGQPIVTSLQLHKLRIAHILIDFELWVWPGIEVGHVYHLENNISMTTLSLRPLVYDVENFFTAEEADDIIHLGIPALERSPVDGGENTVDGYSSDRTSFTAFLNTSNVTMDFSIRTAALTRLPSPDFVEKMQLVRYEKGQLFRRHEDYFESKSFLKSDPREAVDEYAKWCENAATKLRLLNSTSLSGDFQNNGKYHPRAKYFAFELLQLFLNDENSNDIFREHGDMEWQEWIERNINDKTPYFLQNLLEEKPYLLYFLIKSWEKELDLGFNYKVPPKPISEVSYYFYWVRWAKEQLENAHTSQNFTREGDLFPKYTMGFQRTLLKLTLEKYSKYEIIAQFNEEWYNYIVQNQDENDVLLDILRECPNSLRFILKPWEELAGDKLHFPFPLRIQHFEPNRFLTLFLYLNQVDEGGETVFPFSDQKMVTGITRPNMEECSTGLVIPARKTHAALFYSFAPDQRPDPLSRHGGCPPVEGVKYGCNLFCWNTNAEEGVDAWSS